MQARVVATVPGAIYAFRRRADGSSFAPYVSPSVEAVFGFDEKIWASDAAPLFSRVHPDDAGAARARSCTNWPTAL